MTIFLHLAEMGSSGARPYKNKIGGESRSLAPLGMTMNQDLGERRITVWDGGLLRGGAELVVWMGRRRRWMGEGGEMAGGMVEQEELERKTLRLLCSVLLKPVTRVELAGLLDAELFTEALHRKLRELLPARITNRGFPDFDLKEFLAPELASEAEIEKLFESVLKMIEMRHGEAESAVEN